MRCPECGGETKVVESRMWAGIRWRRRQCDVCNLRFYTTEEVHRIINKATYGEQKTPYVALDDDLPMA